LEADDKDRVHMLFQCALTVTICAYAGISVENLAVESIKMNETVRVSQSISIDSFFTFADKVKLASGGKMDFKRLSALDLKFNGGSLNLTMHKTLMAISTVMSPELKNLVARLDRQFGLEVFSGSYNKIRLMILACSKGDIAACFLWNVEFLFVSLVRGDATPADFKTEIFSKSRSGAPSWVQSVCTTRLVVKHIQTIISKLEVVDPKLAKDLQEKIMDKMSSPLQFNTAVPRSGCSGVGVEDEDVDEDAGDEFGEENEFMESLKSCLPRGGLLMAEILKKLYDGSHDGSIAKLVAHNSAEVALNELEDEAMGELGKDLKDMMRALQASEVVTSSTNGLPQQSIRELVRNNSDGGIESEEAVHERQEVWKKAVAQRKKFVTFGLVKTPKIITGFQEPPHDWVIVVCVWGVCRTIPDMHGSGGVPTLFQLVGVRTLSSVSVRRLGR
jgi:hypothetical protein